jgi:hypothetical protein
LRQGGQAGLVAAFGGDRDEGGIEQFADLAVIVDGVDPRTGPGVEAVASQPGQGQLAVAGLGRSRRTPGPPA